MQGMTIEQLQANWDKFGRTDPLWSILSHPKMKGNQWNLNEFIATGKREVNELVAYLHKLEHPFPQGTALDFGCGIGRITQPLCDYFETCHGVDIAPSMIEFANAFNRHRKCCFYHLHQQEHLALFADNSLNFIYCVITLQNIPPRYTKKYLVEFMRILAPQGLIVFQVPSHPLTIKLKFKQWVPQWMMHYFYQAKYGDKPVMELHGVPQAEVIRLLKQCGGQVIDIKADKRAFGGWASYQYCVTK